jgi:hypothetical protein
MVTITVREGMVFRNTDILERGRRRLVVHLMSADGTYALVREPQTGRGFWISVSTLVDRGPWYYTGETP